jgi:hypothetical protein
MPCIANILGCWLLGATLTGGAAAEPHTAAAGADELRRQVTTLLADLDSDRFEVRCRADKRLGELVDTAADGPLLAGQFEEQLLRPEISFEVRWHLMRWRQRLPKVSVEPARQTTTAELDQLIRQLDDNSYAVRLGAAERLQWLAGDAKSAAQVMVRLKHRLGEPDLSPETCHRLESLWELARGTWLAADASNENPPAISAAQLNRWIDELAEPIPDSGKQTFWPAHQLAKQELLDLLACDREVPRVKAALESRLGGVRDDSAAARLKELLELTRPAMVAECWQRRHCVGEQHLLIGVPSQPPGAPRASHFDRIDEHTVHCVSGNSLSPGDYPVGLAIPHPLQPDALFHLVNLPTPRRRMLYASVSKSGEARRLATLSRRTLDRMLAEKRPLSRSEVWMLGQLDVREMSRFAGKYLNLVDDQQWSTEPNYRFSVQSSRNGLICGLLAVDGTKDAVPGLLDALRQHRCLPPTSAAPYRLPWLAALSIAGRDPWPEVDAWLAGIASQTETLVEGRPDGPELGATAAALLLKRRGQRAAAFDIQPVPEPLLAQFRIAGSRFTSADARKRLQAWWDRQIAKTP